MHVWEVLNGGFGRWGRSDFPLFLRIFPLFYAFFPFFYAFSPFSLLFSASPKGQGQTTAIYCKNGEFQSDPVCTDPVQNFPTRTPPPRENITKIMRPEYSCVIFGGGYGKIAYLPKN